MNAAQKLRSLLDRPEQIAIAELEAFYDGLEPVPEAFMLGEWSGGILHTGHLAEKQLEKLRWVGKAFHSRNDVNPIVCRGEDGNRLPNDIMGKASLREVVYRGVPTATMVYDQHPILDHFKKIDDDTVLGVMDRKGDAFPAYFYLQRL